MKKDSFKEYLLHQYRGKSSIGISARVASDVCSRCLRVEKILQLDLDDRLTGDAETLSGFLMNFEDQSSLFQFTGLSTKLGLRSAIHIYNGFINVNKRRKSRV